MEMGKFLSLAIGFVMLMIMYSIYIQTEKNDDPDSSLRKFIIIYCIITSFALGFLINFNI